VVVRGAENQNIPSNTGVTASRGVKADDVRPGCLRYCPPDVEHRELGREDHLGGPRFFFFMRFDFKRGPVFHASLTLLLPEEQPLLRSRC